MIDDDLRNFVANAHPPARDRAFEVAVMARIERHQFRRALLINATVSVALAVVLAVVTPVLQQIWQTELTANTSLLLAISLLFATYVVLRLTRADS